MYSQGSSSQGQMGDGLSQQQEDDEPARHTGRNKLTNVS